MAMVITSFTFYTLVDRRDILNTIERMEMKNRDRDERILRNEQQIHELGIKLQQCKLRGKILPEYHIVNGKFVYEDAMQFDFQVLFRNEQGCPEAC